ncbi:unnamed protein product [Coffea canephora]|uniref:Uncharacterized protein n=1 Tax=Coffea canephora TaxID=49390 RepID=A0A068V9I6_COFCA|nr:unnamed protein product [Coffea canephora]
MPRRQKLLHESKSKGPKDEDATDACFVKESLKPSLPRKSSPPRRGMTIRKILGIDWLEPSPPKPVIPPTWERASELEWGKFEEPIVQYVGCARNF